MNRIHKFFAQFDAYGAPPTLRARQHPLSTSLISGIISFLFTLFFTFIFIQKIYAVFTFQNISSTQTDWKIAASEAKDDDIFFAVKIQEQDIEKYFSIYFNLYQGPFTLSSQQLKLCKQDQWKQIGQNYKQIFKQFMFDKSYCPSKKLWLQKTYYSPNSTYIIVNIRQCQQKPGSQCLNKSQRDIYYQSPQMFFMTISFLQQKIRLDEKNPISKSAGIGGQFAFTFQRGIVGTIDIGSFSVKTDYGLFPIEENKQEIGNFVSGYRQTSFRKNTSDTTFASIYINMQRQFIKVQRKVGKIDQMLSYAGGLFSIIIGFLGLFLSSFNEYKYQLLVAQGVFQQDKKGNKIRQKQFTFIKYIKYSIYEWIKTLTCREINWDDCKKFDEALQEANSQLDVTNLFKYIQTINTQLNYLIQKSQKDCLSLTKPDKFEGVKRNRQILQYYSTLVKDRDAIFTKTMQQYCMTKMIFKHAFNLAFLASQSDSQKDSKIKNSFRDLTQTHRQPLDHKKYPNKDQLLQKIIEQFKDLQDEGLLTQLSEQLQKVQRQLSFQFYHLQPEIRWKIMEKIPLIVLSRLKSCYDNGLERDPVSKFIITTHKIKIKGQSSKSLMKLNSQGL